MVNKFFNSRYAQLGAYLLIVLLGVIGFMRIEQVREDRAEDLAAQTEQRQNERVELTNQLCIQSEISREALRKQIVATANLARSLVPAQNPELVDEVVRFQDEQIAGLPPIKCEEDGK